MDPAFLILSRTALSSSVDMIKCSGAYLFVNSIASSISLQSMIWPCFSSDSSMISLLTASLANFSISSFDASAISLSSVTKKHEASGSCSAWDKKSWARYSGMAVLSARTKTSDGPAGNSISTSPYTSFLAPVTKTFPGPTIFSTFSIDSVP